jgi:predicted CopG family antitoxin
LDKKIKKMRTLTISVSESEYEKFGLKKENISFSELLDILEREIARKNLREAVKLGKKYGFSNITMEEIDKEIKAIRANAKSDN